jgi:hypothetical protein
MNPSKTVLAAVLLSASFAFACGGTDSTGGDNGGTSGTKKTSRNSEESEEPTGETSKEPTTETEKTETENCSGSSICINGSCKCESGPQKGKSCCYAPEEEDDPPCAKANECDNVCNSCD